MSVYLSVCVCSELTSVMGAVAYVCCVYVCLSVCLYVCLPCPEKNETNNILGITLTKFNKFSQFLAQFMLTCLLTKKL